MLLKRLAVIGAVLLLAGCAQLPLGGTSRLVVDSINKLPKVLDETSGLAQQGGVFWSHNDSGGEAAVYAVNAQGDLLKTVHLRGAQNYDWEEMAQDADYLYVADIGDNRAKRQQLIIYAVAWDALSEAKDGAAVPSRQLTISIADKPEQLGKDHNFDFEGLTNVGDKLWLFSKNRGDGSTRIYQLDKKQAKQNPAPVASYPVDMLLTAADYSVQSGKFVLLGYKLGMFGFSSYLWQAPISADGQGINWHRAERFAVKPGGQWEAVIWDERSQNQILISQENTQQADQSLGHISLP